jgi:hypothetical protein
MTTGNLFQCGVFYDQINNMKYNEVTLTATEEELFFNNLVSERGTKKR